MDCFLSWRKLQSGASEEPIGLLGSAYVHGCASDGVLRREDGVMFHFWLGENDIFSQMPSKWRVRESTFCVLNVSQTKEEFVDFSFVLRITCRGTASHELDESNQ